MILNTNCHNCRRPFEYEDSQIGELIGCPDCGHKTLLDSGKRTTPLPPAPSPKMRDNRGLKILFLSIGGALIIAIAAIAIWYGTANSEAIAGGIFSGAIGMLAITVAIIGFILAVFWTVFPLMVYSLLNRILIELQKIENNSRK